MNGLVGTDSRPGGVNFGCRSTDDKSIIVGLYLGTGED